MAISLRYQRRIVSGGDDARDLRQDPPAEFVTAHSESTTLGVRQAKRPRAQVFSEDPILLPEIVDQIVLVTVHPASEREDEELQRRRHSLRLLGRLDQHRPSLGRFFAPYDVVGRNRDFFKTRRKGLAALDRLLARLSDLKHALPLSDDGERAAFLHWYESAFLRPAGLPGDRP